MATLYYYRIFCITESIYNHIWSINPPTVCPNNNTHTVDVNSVVIEKTETFLGNFDENQKLLVTSGVGGYTQTGEQRVSMYNPLFQNYTLYNINNTQLYKIFTANGGSVTGNSNGCELDINISSTSGSYSIIRSIKVCKYRPGYNIILKWNAVFDTPVSNLLQFGGLANNGSDIYFCYNGLDFGVRYSTGGYSEIRKLTVTSPSNSTGNAVITLNNIAYTVPLTSAGGNSNFTAYQIAKFSYPGWIVTSIDSIVNFVSTEVGSKNGTYSYVSSISAANFSQTKAGSSLVTTFVNRSSWNGPSRMVQDLNPLTRNMYSLNFTWYGSGNMTFKVFDPISGHYEIIHTIRFANNQLEPSISQPNMYLQQGIVSNGSTVAKNIKIAGGFAAVEGNYKVNYPVYGVNNSISISSNIETCILSLKLRDSISGFINNSESLIRELSFNAEGNKGVRIKIIKNPTTLSDQTTTNYTNWKYIDQNQSITLYDTTSRTFTGGIVLATYFLPKSGSLLVDLNNREITIFKEDIVIITAFSTSISDIDAAITIVEDY